MVAAESAAPLDSRLAQRFRGMMLMLALPLFVVVLVLAIVQYREQRESSLQDLAEAGRGHAILLDAVAKQANDHVLQMKAWSEGFLTSPPSTPSDLRRHFTARRTDLGEADGYTLDRLPSALQKRVGQVLWWEDDPRRATTGRGVLDQALEFFSVVRLTHEVSPHFRWSYIFPAGQNFFSVYPWVTSRELVEKLDHASLNKAMSSYFSYEVFVAGTPKVNPDRKAYWTEPYIDAAGTGPMVSHAAPYYVNGQFGGIVGTDVRLATLQAFIKDLARPVGRLLIVDAKGFVLADSAGLPDDVLPKFADLKAPDLDAGNISQAAASPRHYIDTPSGTLFAHPLGHAPWHLVGMVSNQEINGQLLPRFVPYGVILAALALSVVLTVYMLRREFILPALKLVDYIQRLSRQDQQPVQGSAPHLPRLWQPWVETVAETFQARRTADFRLKASEAFKTAIVENGLLAVVTMDEEGHVVEFNRAAEKTFGYNAQDVLGQDMAELIIPPAMRGMHRAGVKRFLDSGQSRILGSPLEINALHRSGHELPVELTIFATTVGERRYFTAFLLDLTERRQAAAELARQREALRQSEKLSAMGALLAGVAHELNNPLAILMGRAALLEDKVQDPALRADTEKIRNAAERCGRIVRTFLSMARRRPPEHRAASLNDVVEGAVDLLGYNLRTAGVRVNTQLDSALPQVEMDADQIGQVVLNLIVNAEHALQSRAGERSIDIRTRAEEDLIVLRVSDNGPGVPEDLRERIFDPFFTTKSEGTGTGIGLSVSRAIAREHGGELLLENLSDGASFVLRLPRCTRSADTPAPVPVSDSPNSGRVLVVDDEPEVADLLADILRSAGYATHVVHSGQDGLAWLADNACDFIFCDIRMPDMNGPELYRAIRSRNPTLAARMGFVTGDTLSASIAPFLQETGLPCLEKPFTPEEVLQLAARVESA